MYSNAASSRNPGGLGRRRSAANVNPVKPLAILSVIIPIFVTIVYIVHSSRTSLTVDPGAEPSLGPASRESVYNVNTTGAFPLDRTAYVTTLTHGRWDSYARFVGIRVLLESLKQSHSGSGRAVVVLVSDGVPPEQVTILRSHGASIVQMPASKHTGGRVRPDVEGALALPKGLSVQYDPVTSMETVPRSSFPDVDPVAGVDSPFAPGGIVGVGECHAEFASVHAWGLHGRYDRVVLIEPHLLPILKMDELFLCGEFCMVYTSLTWFQTSVIVLRPSEQLHRAMLERIAKRVVVGADVHDSPSDTGCQTAYEDFVFQTFTTLEQSPFFTPIAGQQHAPVMRLSSGYAVNPLYWYEKYNWNLARVKEYSNMSGTTVFQVPAHALGWQRHKPWYWFPGIYFNVHWVWAHHRAVFLQESFVLFNCIAVAAIIATAILSGAPLDAAVQALLKGNREPLPPLVGANANSGGGASTGGANGAGGGGGAGAGNANTGNGVDKLNGADGTVDASGVPSAGAAATSGGVLGRAALKISVGLGQLVSSIGWNIPGLVVGVPCACLAGVLVHALIPIHIMYYYAWPLMILGVAAVQLVFLRLFALVITLPLIGSAAWSAPATSAPAPPVSSLFSSFWTLLYPGDGGRSVSSLLQHLCESGTLAPSGLSFCARTIASPSSLRFPVIFMLFCLSVLHGDIYAHFVLKIIIMYSMVGISCVLLAVPFVQALRAHHFSRAGLGRWT